MQLYAPGHRALRLKIYIKAKSVRANLALFCKFNSRNNYVSAAVKFFKKGLPNNSLSSSNKLAEPLKFRANLVSIKSHKV
jgi:hypothetical protein